MAKTIYEMAVAYATEDGEDGKPIVIRCEKNAVIFGANAVLAEIESVLKEDEGNDRPWLLKGERLYNKLATKIKELKGE